MGGVVVIGEGQRVSCYGLAGARVLATEGVDEIEEAWSRIPPGTTVAVMTRRAAAVLDGRFSDRPDVLPVVMDE